MKRNNLFIIFTLLFLITSCITEKTEIEIIEGTNKEVNKLNEEIESLEKSNKEKFKEQGNQTIIDEGLNETYDNKLILADANVLFVKVIKNENDWTFYVTVTHPDTGWDDYVDGWDIVLPNGTVIKPDENKPFTRQLMHPHINEQPFVRSQAGILIPNDTKEITIKAHDLIDGFGGKEIILNLAIEKGENYEIIQ